MFLSPLDPCSYADQMMTIFLNLEPTNHLLFLN